MQVTDLSNLPTKDDLIDLVIQLGHVNEGCEDFLI